MGCFPTLPDQCLKEAPRELPFLSSHRDYTPYQYHGFKAMLGGLIPKPPKRNPPVRQQKHSSDRMEIKQLKNKLRRRTTELANSNRLLKRGSERCKSLEALLK